MTTARARVDGTSITNPELNASAIDRERLVHQLDALLDRGSTTRMMLISAPAGFGKTTLVSAWAHKLHAGGHAVAWCSLGSSDCAVFRFWSLVLAALGRADTEVDVAMSGLAAPHQSQDYDFLLDVLDCLQDVTMVLILDNVHLMQDPAILQDLDWLISRLPQHIALVLASRADPPLEAVQHLKLQGRLGQIRAADLSFTSEEIHRVCPRLSASEITRVWERTEGWPALVRLLNLAIQESGHLDIDAISQDTSLADYLFQEVFFRQEPEAQRILLRCSVPREVPLDLAVKLSDSSTAGQVLDTAALRSGLVTCHPDRAGMPCYRFHPILRAYLHAELLRQDRDAEHHVHRQASEWFLASGSGIEAIEHAIAADQPHLQEQVLASIGVALVNAGEAGLLLHVLEGSSAPTMPGQPWTHTVVAAALLDLGRVDEALTQLLYITPQDEHTLDPQLRATRRAVEGQLRLRQGLPYTAAELNTPGSSSPPDLQLLLALHRGAALLRQGTLEPARAQLEAAVALARGLGRPAALINALTYLSAVHCSQSGFAAQASLHAEVFTLAAEHGWNTSPRVCSAHVLTGFTAWLELDDTVAREHAERAAALVEPHAEPGLRLAVSALQATVRFRMDQELFFEAERLQTVWTEITHAQVPPALLAYIAIPHARHSVRLHRTHWITHILDRTHRRLGDCGELHTVDAILQEALGHRTKARRLLAETTRAERRSITPLGHLEALVLEANLAAQDGDKYTAVSRTRHALDLSAEIHALRPFCDAGGEPLLQLLHDERGRWGIHEPLVERVLDYAHTPMPLTVALTPRELEVLRELPTLRTVEEIAASLYLSVNTVKTHLRSTYRKLGSTSRRETITVARRLGLLP